MAGSEEAQRNEAETACRKDKTKTGGKCVVFARSEAERGLMEHSLPCPCANTDLQRNAAGTSCVGLDCEVSTKLCQGLEGADAQLSSPGPCLWQKHEPQGTASPCCGSGQSSHLLPAPRDSTEPELRDTHPTALLKTGLEGVRSAGTCCLRGGR